MFYNTENLFYPTDDSLKNDDEFTPEGLKHWTFKRYQTKINQIAKTLIAVGEWEPPTLIGLCEVENIQCLNDLVYNSPLKRFGYEIIHYECADRRGIDVAVLYNESLFEVDATEPIPVPLLDGESPTRDILYVKGHLKKSKDTVHFFVNHWPSRYGGQLATEPKRIRAAQTLKARFDSIQKVTIHPTIVAMGDFNDHPDDKSMFEYLKAKKSINECKKDELINLIWQYGPLQGTHKYQHQWGILDQIIVNPGLLTDSTNLYTNMNAAHIFKADWLLEDETDGIGQKLNRTYLGYQYHGGYSDHLPIYLDLFLRK